MGLASKGVLYEQFTILSFLQKSGYARLASAGLQSVRVGATTRGPPFSVSRSELTLVSCPDIVLRLAVGGLGTRLD